MSTLTAWSLLFFVVFSCTEEETDIRDKSVGTYDYKLKVYTVKGSTTTRRSDLDDSGTMIVRKSANGIEIVEGGDVQFEGVKIAEASNGFTFDVPTQTVKDSKGNNIVIKGNESIKLGSVLYDGAYFADKKQLKTAFR